MFRKHSMPNFVGCFISIKILLADFQVVLVCHDCTILMKRKGGWGNQKGVSKHWRGTGKKGYGTKFCFALARQELWLIIILCHHKTCGFINKWPVDKNKNYSNQFSVPLLMSSWFTLVLLSVITCTLFYSVCLHYWLHVHVPGFEIPWHYGAICAKHSLICAKWQRKCGG